MKRIKGRIHIRSYGGNVALILERVSGKCDPIWVKVDGQIFTNYNLLIVSYLKKVLY